MKKLNLTALWSEVYASITFPTFLTLFYFLFVSVFDLSFIEKIVVVVVFSAALTIFMVEKRWDSRNRPEIMVLRRLVLLATGAIILLSLGQNNSNKTSFDIFSWLIPAALFIVMSSFFVSFRDARFFNSIFNSNYYYSEISKLLVFFLTAVCVWQYWVNFGTQYVWIPAAISLSSIFTWHGDVDFPAKRLFSLGVVIANIIVLAVSNLYYLGCLFFAEIKKGFRPLEHPWIAKTAEILVIIIAIILVVFAAIKITSKRNERKIKKLAAKEAEERQTQKLAADAKAQKQLEEIKEKIISGHGNNWKNILTVARYYNLDRYYNFNIDKFQEICEVIYTVPLSEVVTVSMIKKQIVWNQDFSSAVKLIEKIVRNTYRDEKIRSHIHQVNSFIQFLKPYEQFVGYKEIKGELEKNCPTIWDLIFSPALVEKNEIK